MTLPETPSPSAINKVVMYVPDPQRVKHAYEPDWDGSGNCEHCGQSSESDLHQGQPPEARYALAPRHTTIPIKRERADGTEWTMCWYCRKPVDHWSHDLSALDTAGEIG